jgi:hypothetical protein
LLEVEAEEAVYLFRSTSQVSNLSNILSALFDGLDEEKTLGMVRTLVEVCETQGPTEASFDKLVEGYTDEAKTGIVSAHAVLMAFSQEVELRLAPRRTSSLAPPPAGEQQGETDFHSAVEAPAAAPVDWGAESDDPQEELAAGRHRHPDEGAEARPQKRKLERAFMDRGVAVDIGTWGMDYFSDALKCDYFNLTYGWPSLTPSLLACTPAIVNLNVPRYLHVKGQFV